MIIREDACKYQSENDRETWKQVFLELFFSIFLIQNKFVHKSFFNVILREEKKREIKFFQAKKIGTL